MYNVAIIGGGVIGAGIARELSRYDLKIILLEKETDVSTGTSKANSGIVHAGFDPKENTLMAKLNAKGNMMFDNICSELNVPFRRNGSLVVAFDDEQMNHIEKLKQRGINNGIPGLTILLKDDLLKREPKLSPDAKGALFAETAGIIDPMLLTISLMESAVKNSCEYKFNFNVDSITKESERYIIKSGANFVETEYVINAAGVYSAEIHNMVAKPAFKINPRRGQYFLLDKIEGSAVKSVIFPCPTKIGKGILVSPTIHGNLILGPASDDIDDPDDLATTDAILDKARIGARFLVPSITTRNNIRNFSGMRAEPDTDDFIIQEAKDAPKFIDVAGMRSPGLASSPAIAEYVVALLRETGLTLKKKKEFDPVIKRKFFIDMVEFEQADIIRENPLYGRIICRCENITEGDIVDTIKRAPGATTLDGVKRRCRAGMGRCQGGFCAPKVLQILSRELKTPMENIVLEKKNSYILTGKTK
jgi:glycerol-3-phosphate dehydrogenase